MNDETTPWLLPKKHGGVVSTTAGRIELLLVFLVAKLQEER